MVGIVIVSHSARLAEGVAELAREMGGADVQLAATGGLALSGQPLGTDATLVLEAIQSVYSDDGVIVLMDLGSAILSAEMAVENLPPESRAHVVLCEAPLVEGALAAAVQARLGATLEQVIAEARGALNPKASHLGVQVETAAPLPSATPQRITPKLRLTVRNRLGLHARPAARFVQTAGRFPNTEIQVKDLTSGRGPVNARSINAVTTLGACLDHEIELLANGPEAEAALAAFDALAASNFGDMDEVFEDRRIADRQAEPSTLASAHADTQLEGLPASPGIAIGPAYVLRRTTLAIQADRIDNPEAEWEKFSTAVEKTRLQIQVTREAVKRHTDPYTAAIFDAHLLFLNDDALLGPTREAIFTKHLNAAAAWQATTQTMAEAYRTLDDQYLRQRATDVTAVGQQVLLNLLNGSASPMTLNEPCILLADDLTPAEIAHLDPLSILGIATARGGPTSHSAILARTLGIPAVVGLGDRLLDLADGTPLIVDGSLGQVFLNAEAELRAGYEQRAEAMRTAQAEARAVSGKKAITRDGRQIEVAANIGSLADARLAVVSGAEGVGLFRTEFLFLDRQAAPDEEEQYLAYRAVAETLARRPLIIRTLDAGGDKPLPYLNLAQEANPFLGLRAVRLCLARPELFKVQLRAILRTAAEFPVKIMFPMIATLTEWRSARGLLAEAQTELAREGIVVPNATEVGIMVEIPAAALQAEAFAAEVDFFSIGTNDLAQYTLAAERGNRYVATLADGLQPAVLRLIHQVAQAARTHGKWIGVCGELASDPVAAPVLIGLGIDELSMNPPAIPGMKQLIRTLDYASLAQQANTVLEAETVEAVRAHLRQAG